MIIVGLMSSVIGNIASVFSFWLSLLSSLLLMLRLLQSFMAKDSPALHHDVLELPGDEFLLNVLMSLNWWFCWVKQINQIYNKIPKIALTKNLTQVRKSQILGNNFNVLITNPTNLLQFWATFSF